jgi:hypothetical protein
MYTELFHIAETIFLVNTKLWPVGILRRIYRSPFTDVSQEPITNHRLYDAGRWMWISLVRLDTK